ncbi:MAG: ABC transporter permease [Clostridiales bacterium]|nr:ABC transporter permease [Clostridiales bacterium]
MEHILNGIIEAFKLLLSGDRQLYSIIFLSIYVSFTSTLIATLFGVPLGFILGLKSFKYKNIVGRFLYTCMSLPPVVVGLLVAIMISRRGPLGSFSLLFSTTGMIIAQTLLVTPIITGIIFSSSKERGEEVKEICKTLGGNKVDTLFLLIREMKVTMLVAIATGFGRAISEVGAVMIVGGNIKGHTRVMTTFIAMNHSMGNYATSIAMGIVLLSISFITNSILYKYVMGDRR